MTETFRPCAVIPSHDHWQALPEVVAALRRHGLPVLIIDDGSGPQAAAAIAALHDPESGVRVVRRPVNGGKGAAVMDGFRLAQDGGFTHVVQVDADGQHDPAALAALLAAARDNPAAMVSGRPAYDASAPLGRRLGRWITHFWVFIETLSLRIEDSMCGFRVYPLAACLALMESDPPGTGMDFDTEIMVRLFWRGVAPVMVPVRVVYPPGNTSNFRMLRDNVRISLMHTRLVLTLLWRLPSILRHRPPCPDGGASHWAGLAERGGLWGLKFVTAAHALVGRRAVAWVLAPIVLYFFLAGKAQRRASRAYLGRVLRRQPSLAQGFRHFMDFAGAALDTFLAWSGAIPPDAMTTEDPEQLAGLVADPRGAVLVVSHHGAVELCRALMPADLRRRVTVLAHTRHAENYNRMLSRFRGAEAGRMIQVAEIGPDTAIVLREAVERGEWVAIAGDRVPLGMSGSRKAPSPGAASGGLAAASMAAGSVPGGAVTHTTPVPFLGAPAPFSNGPWLLASVLDCPVHLLFCRRTGPGRWRFAVEPFAERIQLPRGKRAEALAGHVAAYAGRLERECRDHPWQWYNFFDFWAEGRSP
ncbi:glycosyltransferase [Magnetospirillum sp. UT-4]|uniref:glycosyltransferase family 2 protein n=1 Tax=Magnetospirillum sp. UT-4 TaxID=2681467 RepID=UPI001385DF4D|nr:glycosyltransferase family 2 protein [Magnetospirillum sp. UT-4]CAA7626552.1 Acyltransferase [Magnetospirillum sp. UT-4]